MKFSKVRMKIAKVMIKNHMIDSDFIKDISKHQQSKSHQEDISIDIDFTKNMNKGMLESGSSQATEVIVDTRFKTSQSKLCHCKKNVIENFCNYLLNTNIDSNSSDKKIKIPQSVEHYFNALYKSIWTSDAKTAKVPQIFKRVLNQQLTLEDAKKEYKQVYFKKKKKRIYLTIGSNQLKVVKDFCTYLLNTSNNKKFNKKLTDNLQSAIDKQKGSDKFFKNLYTSMWTSRGRKEKVSELFISVLKREKTLEESKAEYANLITKKKKRIVESLTKNKILYEIGAGDIPTITPQTIIGKILQALTKKVQTQLNSSENTQTGKDIVAIELSEAIGTVVDTFFAKEQNKRETQQALLLENKLTLNDNQEELLCDNNLIYLCHEGLEQFLKKANTAQKRKNKVFYYKDDNYSKNDTYRKKIARNIRGIIHNKMTSQAIEGGKILFYYKKQYFTDTTITIEVLQHIKARETYFKNLLDAVAFSYHSLKGKLKKCVYSNDDKHKLEEIKTKIDNFDVLGFNLEINLDTLEPFHELFLLEPNEKLVSPNPEDDKKKIVGELLKSIQQIRHTTTHYNIKIQNKNVNILSSYVNQAINRKIQRLGESIATKFKSNNFFKYYSEKDLTAIFTKITFDFMEKPTVFPSFSKVLKRARNNTVLCHTKLLKHLRNQKENLEVESEDVTQVKSCEYLLQNVYMHYFRKTTEEQLYEYLKDFISSQAMKNFLANGKESYATTIIPIVKEQSNFREVLIALQKLESKFLDPDNREQNQQQDKENYIQCFKLDFFGYVFFNKIISQFPNFEPQLQDSLTENSSYETVKNILNQKIDFTNLKEKDSDNYKAHLSKWFLFTSLLDNKVISELKQQTHRYLSSIWGDWYKSEPQPQETSEPPANETPEDKIEREKAEQAEIDRQARIKQIPTQLSEVMQLFSIFLHCNEDTGAEHKDIDIQWLEDNFIDENLTDDEMEGIYIQGSENSPILHANILKITKYDSLPLISQVIQSTHTEVCSTDLYNYTQRKKDIERLNQRQKYLHSQILTDGRNASNEDISEYTEVAQQLAEYKQLSNKILLNDVKKLNHIVTSIHSRYVKYMQKLERDAVFVQYFVIGRLSNVKKYKKDSADILTYYDEKTKNHKKGFQAIEKVSEFLLHLETKSEVKRIRDYISHYTLLTPDRTMIVSANTKVTKSFIDVFNDIRMLMSYDRKTLNSLPSMFKNILKKYNVDISFKLIGKAKGDSRLSIKSLKNCQEQHLKFLKRGKDKLYIESNSEDFRMQLEELLEYNSSRKKDN